VICPDYEDIEQFASGALDEGSSADLRRHVAECSQCGRMLDEVEENLRIIAPVKAAMAEDRRPSAAGRLPESLGGYRIVRRLGQGGMGVVYEALQENPRRPVALKVIHAGRASREAVRRFTFESAVLARLRHPGIAQVYEAGAVDTDGGDRLPYFAMEFVEGPTLRAYVERERPPLRRRLALLADLCDAVHYAHQRGVIHRDLKPGNILIDADGRPKILDFGVARVTDGDLQLTTVQTQASQVLGTLPYMSPEQVAGDALATDTRSDVYALGVVAFETLSGRLPYDLKGRTLPEAARIIESRPPERLGRQAPDCTGDVECIVAKALEKEKEQRYGSAAEMAADIRRFLADEPILARPPSVAYQLRKFARRNRILVTAAGVVVLVLVGATLFSAQQAWRAVRAEADARVQFREARSAQAQAEASAEAARLETAKLAATNQFLQDLFASVDPAGPQGARDVTVAEVLSAAARQLDEGGLPAQPEVEAAARTAVGNAFRALGKPSEAEPQLLRAVELGREVHPEGHADLAFSLHKLARVYEYLGRYEEAEATYRESLAMRRAILGEEHADVATSLNNLGWLRERRGNPTEAEALHREALAIRRALWGEEHVEVATSLNNLASALYAQGRLQESEALYRQSLDLDRRLRGETHANVAATMSNLAVVLQELDQFDEALSLLRDAVRVTHAAWGEDHPNVATAMNNLARLLANREQYAEAEQLYRDAIEIERRARGPGHPNVVNSMTNLAAMLVRSEALDQAEAQLDEVMRVLAEHSNLPPIHGLSARFHQASLRLRQERYVEAEAIAATIIEDAAAALPPNHWYLGEFLMLRARCLKHLERIDESRALFREARTILAAAFGEEHPRVAKVDAALAELETQPPGE